jgi:hypothetical protein
MKAGAVTAAVSALTMLLLLVPLDASAGVHGMGMHGGMHGGVHAFPFRGHFAQHRFFRNRQFFGGWPWYGYYDYPYDDSDSMNYSTPQVVVVHEPAPRPPCQHSEQTVTVPSENGGTRQVTILRC